MEKHNKIKKHIEEAKRVLDLFYKWYEKDLNNEIYENIITALDEIIDELYGAQLKAIELYGAQIEAIELDEEMELKNE